jgi:hypothetical protein
MSNDKSKSKEQPNGAEGKTQMKQMLDKMKLMNKVETKMIKKKNQIKKTKKEIC